MKPLFYKTPIKKLPPFPYYLHFHIYCLRRNGKLFLHYITLFLYKIQDTCQLWLNYLLPLLLFMLKLSLYFYQVSNLLAKQFLFVVVHLDTEKRENPILPCVFLHCPCLLSYFALYSVTSLYHASQTTCCYYELVTDL
jgi:hypothetical protein